tara:strand:+ start:2563 stop:3021 length:459 start_codon:yes stop_codon:yes gene_type:complete
MESLLKRGKKFYKDNKQTIDTFGEVASFVIPGGLLAQGLKAGIKYSLAANRATNTFKATNKMPKFNPPKAPKGTSGNWFSQNRFKEELNFMKDRARYKGNYERYKMEQSNMANKFLKDQLKTTVPGTLLAIGNFKRVTNRDKKNNPDRYRTR